MIVLWLTNILLPQTQVSTQSSGLWLEVLASALMENPDIGFHAVMPVHKRQTEQKKLEKISYNTFELFAPEKHMSNQFTQILQQTKPDIIHIWGTEFTHAKVMVDCCCKLGLIDRVVVDLQGLAYYIAQHYASGLPFHVIHRATIRNILKKDTIYQQKQAYERRGRIEMASLRRVKNVMGRTDWDAACMHWTNPQINYYPCNRIMRHEFYGKEWQADNCERHSLFMAQAFYPIKGLHFALEAISLLRRDYPDVHLYIAGLDHFVQAKTLRERLKLGSYGQYIRQLLKKYDICDQVTFCGQLNTGEMVERMLQAHVCIVPSTIENLSNSMMEAMLMGVPVISADVGGMHTLIKQGINGYVYQHDAPYMLAYYAHKIFSDREGAIRISATARANAAEWFDRDRNIKRVLAVYQDIVSQRS